MKLLRYGPPGRERPACLDTQGTLRDLYGSTRTMVFGVAKLVGYIRDVITTGTPPGVGLGRKPPRTSWRGT